MSILTSSQIQARLKLPIDDPRSMVLTPLLGGEQTFSADSVDLRLGSNFLMPRVPPQPFVCLDPSASTSAHQRIHVPWGSYLVVPAHETVLGATLEFIKLPWDTAGLILTKSSVARTFVVIETAPWIHPAYRGCLTLEIANVSNTPLLLHPGLAIGQLILQTTGISDAELPTNDRPLRGSYLGPVYPESPKFKGINEELAVLGVKNAELPHIK